MSDNIVDFTGLSLTPEMESVIQAVSTDPEGVRKTMLTIQGHVQEYVRLSKISSRSQISKNIFVATMAVVFWAEHRHVRDEMLRGFYDKFVDYVVGYDVDIDQEELRHAMWSMVDNKSLESGNIRIVWQTYLE